MSEAHHLSEGVSSFLTNTDNGWHDSLPYAVEGLTAAQAAQSPGKGFNSIWQVVDHMRYWHEFFLQRLQGEPKPDLGPDWAVILDPADDAAWKASLERLYDVNRRLCACIETLPDPKLDEETAPGKPRYFQIFQGAMAHTSYHICEVITIRHMLGLWLERT
jgi:uncharacterized damage-inducible protein DinB